MFGRFRKNKNVFDEDAPPVETVIASIGPPEGRLLQVIGPEDGACVCNDWVGAVLAMNDGSDEYPSLSGAIADGLFHPECRHTLRPYPPESGGHDNAQAQFRTQLALDLMRNRANANDPDGEERFTRLYGWARRADQAGAPEIAVVLCEAALRLLAERNIFGPTQPELETVLKARIATIRTSLKGD